MNPENLDMRPEPESTDSLSLAVTQMLESYLARMGCEESDNIYQVVMQQVEGPLLACVLRHCQGNQSRAAQLLGMNRATLRKKLRHYGLN